MFKLCFLSGYCLPTKCQLLFLHLNNLTISIDCTFQYIRLSNQIYLMLTLKCLLPVIVDISAHSLVPSWARNVPIHLFMILPIFNGITRHISFFSTTTPRVEVSVRSAYTSVNTNDVVTSIATANFFVYILVYKTATWSFI